MSEQLWYTWSFNGLGRSNGLRVRAASTHLQEVEGQRVRSLINMIGYALPEASDQFLPPEEAPLCLAFLKAQTNQEAILMQKRYTGLDGQRRPGAFFSHLITDLPTVSSHSHTGQLPFSAYEAISLWRSALWQDTETRFPEGKYDLPPVPPDQLVSGVYDGSLNEQTINRLPELFDLAFRAFLTLGLSSESRRLYLVGEPDTVAAVIWGITRALPKTLSLMQRLTFSTFEANVENDVKPLIVGTSWQPRYLKKGYENSPLDLPDLYYQANNPYGITIHCTTLRSTPFTISNPLTTKYTRFVQQCFTPGTQGMTTLSHLREAAEKRDISEIPALLQHYVQYHEMLKEEDVAHILTALHDKAFTILEQADLALTREKLTDAIAIFSSLDSLQIEADVVKRENVQNSLLNLMLQKPNWWQNQGERLISQLYQLARRSTSSQVTEKGRRFTSLIVSNKQWQKNQGMDLIDHLQPFSSVQKTNPQELLTDFTNAIKLHILETQNAIKDALLPLIQLITEQLSQILHNDQQTSLSFWNQTLEPYLSGPEIWEEAWSYLLQTLAAEMRANQTSQSWLQNSKVKSRLTQLRSQITASDNTELSQAFSTFASSISQQLLTTLPLDNISSYSLSLWSELFKLIAPPVKETEVWVGFLHQLGALSYSQVYKHWYQYSGKESLETFARLAEQPENSSLHQSFLSYLNAASHSLQNAMLTNKTDAISFWTTLLLELLTTSNASALWLALLFALRSHTASDGFVYWWNLQGKNTVVNLRLLAEKGQIDPTRELLPFAEESAEMLARYISAEAQNNQYKYDDSIILYLEILTSSVPAQDTQIWSGLLQKLAQVPTSYNLRWELRAKLLKAWKNVKVLTTSEALDKIIPWLKVSWELLDNLLALNLPEKWSKRAITNILDSYAITSPDRVFSITTRHFTLFEDILQDLINTPLQANAIAFFAFLAQQKYSRILSLLDKLTTACNYQKETVEKLLQASRITTEQQVIELLEQHCHKLLTSYELSPILLNFIKGYLAIFDLSKLDTDTTKSLFVRLRNRKSIPALRLPEDIEQEVESWYKIAAFLTLPKATAQDLRNLTRLSPEMQQKLATKLIPKLVTLITSEADLTRTLDALRPDDPLPLLQELVRVANEKYKQEEQPVRLVPYARMILMETHHLAQEEREIFVNDCFLALFKDVETKKRDDYLPEKLWPEELKADWNQAMNFLEALTNLRKALSEPPFIPAIADSFRPAFEHHYLEERDMEIIMLAKRFVAEYDAHNDQNMLQAADSLKRHYTSSLHYTREQIERIQAARQRLSPQGSRPLPSLPGLTHNQNNISNANMINASDYQQPYSPSSYNYNPSTFNRSAQPAAKPHVAPAPLTLPAPAKEPVKIVASVSNRNISLDTYKNTFEVRKAYTQMKIQQLQLEIQKMEENPRLTTKGAIVAFQRDINDKRKELNDVTKFSQITLQELVCDILILDEINVGVNNPIENQRFQQFHSNVFTKVDSVYAALQKSYKWDSHFPLDFNNPSTASQIKQALQIIIRLELFNKEFVKDPTGTVNRIKERFKTATIHYNSINVPAPRGKGILG